MLLSAFARRRARICNCRRADRNLVAHRARRTAALRSPGSNDVSDVIVVGAGPAGATAAIRLARAGRRVLLIDRDEFPRDKICGDLIGAFAINEMRRLDIDLAVVRETSPLRGAFVSAPSGSRLGATLSLDRAQRLGARVVPRSIFDAALVACAIDAGATFLRARITGVEFDRNRAICGVRTADGQFFRAPITIGADGWSSVLARAIVPSPREQTDAGIAVRAYVDGFTPDAGMRFFIGAPGDGYGWIFPLADGRANVGLGFIRGEPGAEDVHGAFLRFFTRPELRDACLRGPARAWPIPFGWRGTPVSTAGALLVGDAASLASSLSGSGIHTAIASGAIAADVADTALDRGDVTASALRAYDRRLAPIANRLRAERWLHGMIGTPAGSSRAIGISRRIPGAGRVAVDWLLSLG